ncbi:rod shape-determining protein MreC [Desulfovibrio sp. OttesenSCG-928-C14]|nr:rod shape-determining protein MreC [Desulfovibrio sp. OttesenSCG-928-C14]
MSNPKRIIILFGLVLVLFLALYTWDARTGSLSRISSSGGLEISRHLLAPGVWLKDRVSSFFDDYVAITDVAGENLRLREELDNALADIAMVREDLQELERLRRLLSLPPVAPWEQASARVVAGKFGPQAALNSVMLSKGFVRGAVPGAPVVQREGLVGKIFHASPNSSTVLLLNDPSFRVAVIGQESRVRGILAGTGAQRPLEVLYVAPNTNMKPGELLVCSGIDGTMPKGVPAARVEAVHYDQATLFPHITALPLADLDGLEEVVVLIPPLGQKAEDLVFSPYPEQAAPDGVTTISDEEAAQEMSN